MYISMDERWGRAKRHDRGEGMCFSCTLQIYIPTYIIYIYVCTLCSRLLFCNNCIARPPRRQPSFVYNVANGFRRVPGARLFARDTCFKRSRHLTADADVAAAVTHMRAHVIYTYILYIYIHGRLPHVRHACAPLTRHVVFLLNVHYTQCHKYSSLNNYLSPPSSSSLIRNVYNNIK